MTSGCFDVCVCTSDNVHYVAKGLTIDEATTRMMETISDIQNGLFTPVLTGNLPYAVSPGSITDVWVECNLDSTVPDEPLEVATRCHGECHGSE